MALILAGFCAPREASAQAWARDSRLHFSLSAAMAGGAYGLSAPTGWPHTERLAAAAALSLSVGVAKELYDLSGRGDPEWRDLAWDALGTLTGLALSRGLEWIIEQALGRDAGSPAR